MKTVWTLNVKTSLPNVCETEGDFKVTNEVYESFGAAKKRMREIIKEYAFTDNAMFDGNGYLKNFTFYIDDLETTEEEYDEVFEDSDWVTSSLLKNIHENLHDAFSGIDLKLDFSKKKYFDCYICVKLSNNALQIKGHEEGPINGIDPKIKTNIFDMTEEKDYMLYIDDFFCGLWDQECSAELYIDLTHTEIDE